MRGESLNRPRPPHFSTGCGCLIPGRSSTPSPDWTILPTRLSRPLADSLPTFLLRVVGVLSRHVVQRQRNAAVRRRRRWLVMMMRIIAMPAGFRTGMGIEIRMNEKIMKKIMNIEDLLLRVENLVVEFPAGRGRTVHAVSGVSFDLGWGETLGLVGESGCGKSSLARAVMQLPGPTSGKVILDGRDLAALTPRCLRPLRGRFQMIFQDPVSSLNPSRSAGESIAAPLSSMGGMDKAERVQRTREMMTAVGLDPEQHYGRKPQQLSGGQCQRAGIARALMTGPRLLVCDEPVSSLDVSVQAQILNLLRDIKQSYALSMLLIAHDLAVV